MQSVGVLALQGSFSEHLTKLAQLTEVLPVAVKTAADLEQVDRLILPGGESTAISRLLQRTGLSELLKRRVKDCLLYTSPSPRDSTSSRMPSSA